MRVILFTHGRELLVWRVIRSAQRRELRVLRVILFTQDRELRVLRVILFTHVSPIAKSDSQMDEKAKTPAKFN